MRRRSRAGSGASFLGLDSFLDIVTNVIGALFFVVIYAALAAFGAAGRITMPMAAPADTKRILVEARGSTVFFTDADSLLARSNAVWREASALSFNARVARLRNAGVGNAFYEYRPEVETQFLSTRVVDTLVPRPGSLGENGTEIRGSMSVFRTRLATYDPAEHHIIFLARTDSFEVFHTARNIVIAAGFRVGWEPIEADEPLRFSTGGRDLAVY
jgi:hypothetical protein